MAPRAGAGRLQLTMTAADARRVLLVQAFETGPADNPQWTAEDRAWATRLARATTPPGAPPQRFLTERTGHALQRLAPRDAGVLRALAQRGWHTGWWLAALLIGLLAGVAVDAIGSGQRINLLAPPVWGVVAWNGLVYLGLLLSSLMWPVMWPVMSPVLSVVWPQFASRKPPLRAKTWLTQRLACLGGRAAAGTPMARFQAAWLHTGGPLLRARAALLLHSAAAALALGLIGGLYLRGLVLDYRAGWQSTFLDATQVRAALALLLAPAVAVTGIAVPDAAALQALRVAPGALPVASAAPWIHLYAALLGLCVVLPRGVLAALCAWRAWHRVRRLALPAGDLYIQRLLLEQPTPADAAPLQVQVLAHGAAPSPHALACLRAVLAPALGAGVQITAAAATAYGDEDEVGPIATRIAAGAASAAAPTLRLALVDLVATPEADSHGAFVRALRRAAPAAPLLVLADETAFRTRFGHIPGRLNERRAAWHWWAQTLGVGLVCVDLAQPDAVALERDLQTALQAAVPP